MSHEVAYPITPLEQLSEEEQIQYIEDHLEEIVAALRADKAIPPWDVEILADRLARHRSESEGGIPWEEFKQEFMENE